MMQSWRKDKKDDSIFVYDFNDKETPHIRQVIQAIRKGYTDS